MKKLFLLLIKFIPVIQMAGMLINNTLYHLEIPYISIALDFTIGNSYITTFLLYVCNIIFGFCKWHRTIITANFININIAFLDSLIILPITDIQLLSLYYIIASIAIIIITINHIKNAKYKIKYNKKSS